VKNFVVAFLAISWTLTTDNNECEYLMQILIALEEADRSNFLKLVFRFCKCKIPEL
jgi:hypothetical protein